MNRLHIGDKVMYEGKIATVIGIAPPFGNYPVVVLEFKSIFADFGPGYQQIDRQSVIEYGLKAVDEMESTGSSSVYAINDGTLCL